MRSKPILFSIIASALMITVATININVHTLPFKTTYEKLTAPAQKQITCLAENIYFEAGHEPIEGKIAVAHVTFNRVLAGNYADSICDVVYQKTKSTCQFSWYCDTKFTSRMNTIKDTPLYYEIRNLATHLIVNFERIEDVTNGATYYHADYVNPGWKRLQKEKQIGRHIFYKSKQDSIDRTKGII